MDNVAFLSARCDVSEYFGDIVFRKGFNIINNDFFFNERRNALYSCSAMCIEKKCFENQKNGFIAVDWCGNVTFKKFICDECTIICSYNFFKTMSNSFFGNYSWKKYSYK